MDSKDLARSWQEQGVSAFLGVEAPRYTSYPTAHQFGPLEAATHARWLGQLRPDHSIGTYVHIPFCEQMCWFCGCNTQITRRAAPVLAYAESLIAEIGQVSAALDFRPRTHSLHFGGGSPGILDVTTLERVCAALTNALDVQAGAEVSIELDPRQVTKDKAEALARLGFNRVSLGVQDTQEKVQAAINRRQPMPVIMASVAALRAAGLQSLGIDLLYGLPFQTLDSLEVTLADVARLDPQRISAFSYAHVPWMKKHQQLIDTNALPTQEEKALQALLIDTHLRAMGYIAVGMDHYAKPDDGLALAVANRTLRRNFMGYTDLPNDRLIAFGASAISQLDDGIAQNIPQSATYQRVVGEGSLPTVRGLVFKGDDKLRADVIAQLMCFFEVDLVKTLEQFGYPADYLDSDIEALSMFVSAGLVAVEGRKVRFCSPHKMLIRSIAAVFDRYAGETHGGRYSRVA